MAGAAADVIAVIARKMDAERPTIALTDRLEDLGLASLDAIDIIYELEEKFNISIPYNPGNSQTELNTVDDFVRAVEGLINGKA